MGEKLAPLWSGGGSPLHGAPQLPPCDGAYPSWKELGNRKNIFSSKKKNGTSVVWRLGGALLEVPWLPSCVGVASQGMELGLVFNDSLSYF
jgi:hypothetical protein